MLSVYADECVDARIVDALRRGGVDVATAADGGLLGASDSVHVEKATAFGRVIISADQDFLCLASELMAAGTPFPGLVFITPRAPIGEAVRGILLVVEVLEPADMVNHVEWVP